MEIKKEAIHSITFGYSTKAGELKAFFSEIPNDARIDVEHYEGDQREPTQTTITATWDI